MTMRILIAGILGGIVMYVWTSVAHVALPIAQIGVSAMSKEDAVLPALNAATGMKRGFYFFPFVDMKAKNAMATEEAKLKVEPTGVLIYQPPGTSGMTTAMLVREFVTELLEALIAAFLLAQTGIATYLGRVGFVALTGVVSALATNVSYWNWYGFPANYTLANMFIEIVGFLVAGFAIAAWLRPRVN